PAGSEASTLFVSASALNPSNARYTESDLPASTVISKSVSRYRSFVARTVYTPGASDTVHGASQEAFADGSDLPVNSRCAHGATVNVIALAVDAVPPGAKSGVFPPRRPWYPRNAS